MTPRRIIARAWALAQEEPSIRKWGFIAALSETLRNVTLLLTQTYYFSEFFSGNTVGFLDLARLVIDAVPQWLAITSGILLVAIFCVEVFVPTLATGAIIGLTAKAHRGEEVRGGLILAISNFFALLEAHGLFILANFTANIAIASFLIRFGDGMRFWGLALLFLLTIFSMVLHVFASFTEEGIVIRKEGVFESIGKSVKLIISHLREIVFLLILFFVITLRIALNAAMVLVIPIITLGIGYLLASFLPTVVSTIITTCVGVALIVLASMFFAYITVFKQAVWTITYLELSAKKDLDVIE